MSRGGGTRDGPRARREHGLSATRQAKELKSTAEGAKFSSLATLKLTLILDGGTCRLQEFSYASKSDQIQVKRGRALKAAPLIESRNLSKESSCRVISR